MKKKIIGAVVAVVVLLVAVFGIIYFATDMFKSPEQLFYKGMSSYFKLAGDTSYDTFLDELKKAYESTYSANGEVSVGVTSTEPTVKELSNILDKTKVKFSQDYIGKENKSKQSYTLNYDNKDIVTLDMLANKDTYGIKVADAYEKYVAVENNNLKALFQKFGVDTTDIPDKIEAFDVIDLLNVDSKTMKNIEKTYSEAVKSKIPESCYSVEKDVTVKIKGEDVKTDAYKLTLTEKQFKEVVVNVLETLKDDNVTLDLIIEKYSKVYELLDLEEMTKEQLVSNINELLNEFKDMSATDDNIFSIVVYKSANDKIKVEVTGGDVNAVTDLVKNGKDIEMISTMTENGEELLNINVIGNDDEATITLSSNGVKFEVKVKIDGNNVEYVFSIDASGTTIRLNVKCELKMDAKVEVEDFTADNSVKLNDMSDAELQALVQTISDNVIKVLPEKMKLLGLDGLLQNGDLGTV